jgi:type VI protein secretion system component VasK
MVGLNTLFLTLLHVAQLALVIVVVVFAIRDIKKGSTHRVLIGSLIALVVLVVITPLLTHATIKEGMEDKPKEKKDKRMASTKFQLERDENAYFA